MGEGGRAEEEDRERCFRFYEERSMRMKMKMEDGKMGRCLCVCVHHGRIEETDWHDRASPTISRD